MSTGMDIEARDDRLASRSDSCRTHDIVPASAAGLRTALIRRGPWA
jgi:hypothetical protein